MGSFLARLYAVGLVLEGHDDYSPAIHRWEQAAEFCSSPVGTAEGRPGSVEEIARVDTLLTVRKAMRSPTDPAIPLAAQPALQPLPDAVLRFAGPLGERLDANLHQWLVPAPVANPAMLQ